MSWIHENVSTRRDEPVYPRADRSGRPGCNREYYLKEASYRIARNIIVQFVEAFRAIARNPGIGHKREDLAVNRPVLFWGMRDYLIIYRAGTKPVEIVAIARGSRDVAQTIKQRDL